MDINFQWQEREEHRLPLAYLKVQAPFDVQFAVKCARKLSLSVVARSGGHGYLKYAYGQNDDKTVVVDLQQLNAISVNQERRIAEVGAGARLGHAAYQLWANGNFYMPYGVCGSVGISGYTLGGGHSYFAHLLGMSWDQVIELEMVNTHGDLLTINNSSNVNLFWALRGAGATGSFGIVTKLTYQIYTAPYQLVRGSVGYSLQRFHEFYPLFQTFLTKNVSKQMRFSLSASEVRGMFVDTQSEAEAQNIGVSRMEEVLELFPSADTRVAIRISTYRQFLTSDLHDARNYGYMKTNVNLTEPSDLMNINSYGTGSEWFKAKSLFVRKLLSADEIMTLQELFINLTSFDFRITAESYVGKIQEFDAHSHSAFVHRDAYYYFFIYMIREKEDDAIMSSRMTEFFEKSKEVFNHTESYQNYADDEMDDFLERYYGANLERLIDIKTEVDPDNFFNTNPQSIPVRRGSGSGARSRIGNVRIVLFSLCMYLWLLL